MIRLALLTATAFFLPNVGVKPADLAERPATISSVAAVAFPGVRFPKFLRINRKRGADAEIVQMKTRLRDLVVQEEAYYAQNGVYGRNVTRIATLSPGDTSAHAVQIQILFANKRGWSAVASHPDAPGRTCVAFVGTTESVAIIPRTRQDANVATLEGIPACDGK